MFLGTQRNIQRKTGRKYCSLVPFDQINSDANYESGLFLSSGQIAVNTEFFSLLKFLSDIGKRVVSVKSIGLKLNLYFSILLKWRLAVQHLSGLNIEREQNQVHRKQDIFRQMCFKINSFSVKSFTVFPLQKSIF